MKKTIVYIIFRDKFTAGYINFFKIKMPKYNCVFFTRDKGFKLDLINNENVFLVSDYMEILKNRNNKYILEKADKIIVSGVFIGGKFFAYLNLFPCIFKKLYFQFWGGDFYCYRNYKSFSLKRKLIAKLSYHTFKNCAGLIFLIDGESEVFKSITHISNNFYIAGVPADPRNKKSWEYIDLIKPHDGIKIIAGNSADPTNCHIEMFEILSRYKDRKIEIYCPLSYASPNEEYLNNVIKTGHNLFGDKFKPILNYMKSSDYQLLLCDMDIGVFGNDRQQAMGNISWLLSIGKKVYIRSDTSMWNSFKDQGYTLFDYLEIPNLDYNSFIQSDNEILDANIKKVKELSLKEYSVNEWRKLLDE